MPKRPRQQQIALGMIRLTKVNEDRSGKSPDTTEVRIVRASDITRVDPLQPHPMYPDSAVKSAVYFDNDDVWRVADTVDQIYNAVNALDKRSELERIADVLERWSESNFGRGA